MKRKKLNLDALKVQSFITELKAEVAHTAKGGDDDATNGGQYCGGIIIHPGQPGGGITIWAGYGSPGSGFTIKWPPSNITTPITFTFTGTVKH